METYEEQILAGFEDESMSSAQESLASQQASPGSEKARMMTAGSGRQCSMLLEESSPLGAFSKILLGSSHWGNSMEYCYVWARQDTRFGLSAFQLTPLGQSTDGNGCLLLGTPDTHPAGPNGQPSSLKNTLGRMTLWRSPNERDCDQAKTPKLWPTPNAGNFNDGESLETWESRKEKNKAKGINGNGQGTPLAIAAKLWPTPTVPNGGRRNPEGTSITGKKPDGGKAQIDLREFAIRLLPTPIASDWKSTSPANQSTNARPLREVMGETGSGSLNPRFVEQLMGYEIDHTDLKRLETPLSPSKRTRSSRRSRKSVFAL